MVESMNPPVVTAYAALNALGRDTREVLASLAEGRSGLRPCPLPVPFEATCGAVADDALEPLPASLAAYDTRLNRMTLRLLDEIERPLDRARRRWGADRVAVVLGTSTAGLRETEDAYARFSKSGQLPADFDWDRRHALHSITEFVRRRAGLSGPVLVVSTACSSGGKVLATAKRWISAGFCDAVLSGGVDTLCQMTVRGFRGLSALSPRPCRPFAADREGTNIGEGGALLLVEREGDGPAHVLGAGETCDAHHMTAPHPEGLGARAAMQESLDRAGLHASQVDHVNAHGTGTKLNDAAEAAAIRSLLGSGVPVVSTKGFTGHLLGAAGATEAVFSVAAIEHGWIPASLGADPPDASLGLRVPRTRETLRCRVVLSNSLAFGGNNVSVAFGAPSVRAEAA